MLSILGAALWGVLLCSFLSLSVTRDLKLKTFISYVLSVTTFLWIVFWIYSLKNPLESSAQSQVSENRALFVLTYSHSALFMASFFGAFLCFFSSIAAGIKNYSLSKRGNFKLSFLPSLESLLKMTEKLWSISFLNWVFAFVVVFLTLLYRALYEETPLLSSLQDFRFWGVLFLLGIFYFQSLISKKMKSHAHKLKSYFIVSSTFLLLSLLIFVFKFSGPHVLPRWF